MSRLLLLLPLLFACQSDEGGKKGKGKDTVEVTGDDDDDIIGDDDDDDDIPSEPLPACDLLTNTDAETGDTSGWTVEVGEWLVKSGTDPVPWEGAYQFFTGQADSSVAYQDIDLRPWLGEIADGDATAHLEVQFRDSNGDDEGFFGLTALDADGEELETVLLGPLTDAAWRLHRAHLTLPTDTVTLRARLGAQRTRGDDNDGYFDGISLCIDELPPPTATDIRFGPWLNWVTPDAISVLWETAGSTLGSVEWSEDFAFDNIETEAASGDHHEVRITGLEPDTVYAYRVKSDDEIGEIYSFRTAPDVSVPFEFAVWGDNQDGPDIFADVVDRIEAAQPDFAVSVGDIVQTGTENNYRNELLDPLLDLTLEVPFLVAAGNHERLFDGDASLFERHLAQPGDEHCFSWIYGGAFFLFIDTELSVVSGPQMTCIEDALQSPEFAASDVQIALFHYPPRIEFWAFYFYGDDLVYDGDDEIRNLLEPAFDTAGVDLVLNGHNHLYAHTPAGTYSNVTWVTTGGGGGAIDTAFWVTGDWDGITTTLHEHHFLRVSVDGKDIDVAAIGRDGTELHQFSITGD